MVLNLTKQALSIFSKFWSGSLFFLLNFPPSPWSPYPPKAMYCSYSSHLNRNLLLRENYVSINFVFPPLFHLKDSKNRLLLVMHACEAVALIKKRPQKFKFYLKTWWHKFLIFYEYLTGKMESFSPSNSNPINIASRTRFTRKKPWGGTLIHPNNVHENIKHLNHYSYNTFENRNISLAGIVYDLNLDCYGFKLYAVQKY